jgi:pectate lyase
VIPDKHFLKTQKPPMTLSQSSRTSFLAAFAITLPAAMISPAAELPAFPGAEGAGRTTTGGKGGAVIEVTSLADSGPGTFRAACLASGARTVVFRVGGIIQLTSELTVRNPDLTLAGHTAPGDGICIRGATVNLDTSNVIIRYMRFRRGDSSVLGDSLGGYPRAKIMIDHVSASWGLDESLSLYRYIDPVTDEKKPIENITIQWSIISETLNKNGHAFGGTWGGDKASFHHNLFACNTDRNASIGITGEFFDWRNNVVFNWVNRNLEGGDGSSEINVVNNYYRHGPATPSDMRSSICMINWRGSNYAYPGPEKFYLSGNHVFGYPAVTADNWNGGVSLRFQGNNLPNPLPTLQQAIAISRVNTPFPADAVVTHSALQAFDLVTAGAGASRPVRDSVDARIINSVKTGTVTSGNGIINLESDVGGYPVYQSAGAPADADHDGMPDIWEIARGLNPNNAADRNGDFDDDSYTNLEEYLNELGAFPAGVDIVWDGESDNRYARIENWNIGFQPSRFDTAVISNATVVVDATGQHAGILKLTGNAKLDITGGSLEVADKLEIATGSTLAVHAAGALNVTNGIVNHGTLRLTGPAGLTLGGNLVNYGVLDLMTWTGPLPMIVNHGIVLDPSEVKIGSAKVEGVDFVVTIQGYPGHNYQLQHRADLNAGAWQDLGAPVAGANAPILFTHSGGATARSGFYRVTVNP